MKLTKSARSFGYLDFIILILSIYVLGALLVDTTIQLPTEISRILNIIDYAICLLFFIDFSINFYKAGNKLAFLKWGWVDLISSIPSVDFLRFGRLLRLIKLLRILKAFRSMVSFTNHFFKNKAHGTFISAAIVAGLLIIFSSIAILQVENHPDSNIKTAEDALWWAYTTITTVGYGDLFPVTLEGRLVAVVLMTAGVGLFGTFSAFLASWFVNDNKENTSQSTHIQTSSIQKSTENEQEKSTLHYLNN